MQKQITEYFGVSMGKSFIVNDGWMRRRKLEKQKASRLKKERGTQKVIKPKKKDETKSQRYNRMVCASAKSRVLKDWLGSKPIDLFTKKNT